MKILLTENITVDNYYISKPICLCNVNLVNLIKHIFSTKVSTVLFQSYFFDCMKQQFTTQKTYRNESKIDLVLERCKYCRRTCDLHTIDPNRHRLCWCESLKTYHKCLKQHQGMFKCLSTNKNNLKRIWHILRLFKSPLFFLEFGIWYINIHSNTLQQSLIRNHWYDVPWTQNGFLFIQY